jgi:hypothetical protein
MQASTLPAQSRVSSARSITESIHGLAAGHHHNSRQSVLEYNMLTQETDIGMMNVFPSTEAASAFGSMSPSKEVPAIKTLSHDMISRVRRHRVMVKLACPWPLHHTATVKQLPVHKSLPFHLTTLSHLQPPHSQTFQVAGAARSDSRR